MSVRDFCFLGQRAIAPLFTRVRGSPLWSSFCGVPSQGRALFLLLAVWRFPPVLSRANGFRGYAERSRREKTWDPGSTFYAEGASKHHVSGPRLCNMRRKGGRGSGANGAPSVDTATKRKHQRDRRRVSADTHPVDMDWAKVKSCLTQVQTKLAI